VQSIGLGGSWGFNFIGSSRVLLLVGRGQKLLWGHAAGSNSRLSRVAWWPRH
jgi:hypothetical protein